VQTTGIADVADEELQSAGLVEAMSGDMLHQPLELQIGYGQIAVLPSMLPCESGDYPF
jgi:hypothetical protein